jgi:glycosyltransferase involved in cell wall biosynthesis
MPPLVSVIIPTFNRWSYLQMTIDSVLAQTYPHIEIIVVDDGSTDQTAEGLQSYSSRIRVIRQTNQGGTAARNTGINAATGDYLTFLDHDDLMLPTKLEQQVALLETHPEFGAAHCRWEYIDPQGNVLDRIGPLPVGNLYMTLVLGCFLWSGAPIVRRHYFEQIGGFDTSIWSSDWDMWLRLSKVDCIFGCVQEILGSYRIMPDSTMSDVNRTETMDIRLLDKAFADPTQVPRAILAVQDEAYAIWRFWLSRRYYATNAPEDGERNLAEALRLHPALLSNRAEFLETLCNEALDVRVSDPFGFIEAIFSHLPAAAESIHADREFVLSQLHTGLALRAYAKNDFDHAQSHMQQALFLYRNQAEHFAKRCAAYAMRLPVKPTEFIKTVLNNLPREADSLKTLRSRLMSEVAIASAFEKYFAGQRRQAGRQIVTAALWQPSWLKNKGVLSVLAKSLPNMILNRE